MKLFIIGNGFDRGHGLPTQYWDFRTFLENRYPRFLKSFEEHYNIYPNMSDNEKADLLWNELEINLANIDEDVIIESAVSIDLDLESGDIGIEDTLYAYFSNEYSYIESLAKYLKQWVRTIRISDIKKKSSFITNDALYISFNYTAVLENVYGISSSRITHIHGSLREYDIDPVLGHGNYNCIHNTIERRKEAESVFDEKTVSILRVIEDYYKRTYKDVLRYSLRLPKISNVEIDEIYVIGHSLAGVDIRYFKQIDTLTKNSVVWNVYYHHLSNKEVLINNLMNAGIDERRIVTAPSSDFYNM